MLRPIAKLISLVFHPLFVVTYLLLILFAVNPYLFSVQDAKGKGLVLISVMFLSILFPMVVIIMLRFLGFIKSLELEDRMERIGPLIGTGLFYLWLYVNIYQNPAIPKAFSLLVLGSTIGLFMAFFMNNFSKVSLHAVGMGGFVTAILLIRFLFSYDYFILELGSLGHYKIHPDFLVYGIILLAGLVGTCRLFLNAHDRNQVLGGFLIGFIAQIIAFRFLY